ncbi:hypothetical protein [Clostridium hydrogenum]|uniref:hypothetical protein n=1 Tax=Clostridium hydrogenum TaxID=2855764 RepID=UPI001F354FCD|nr:hypothetical protein [Clostridium hydrogenum]
MKKHEMLKKEYLEILDDKMKSTNKKELELRQENFIDEGNMKKIKYNIIDIFVKMFNVSYNKVYGKNVIDEINSYNEFYLTYMNFFEKIPASWKVKAEKDKKFDMTKEYIIEKIKLDTMEEVKSIFQVCYDKRL